MLPVLLLDTFSIVAESWTLVAGFVAGASCNGYNLYNVGLDVKHIPIPSGFLGALVGVS